MLSVRKALNSTVGKKYLMAMTGIALVGFLVAHLAGNLLLYLPDGSLFNQYAYGLEKLGPLLYVAELGLLGLFVVHILIGVGVTLANKAARPTAYAVSKSKGEPSKAGFSSGYMIVTGSVLGIFLVLHLIHFKFGESYTTFLEETQVRDLHRLVIEEFQRPELSLIHI